MLGSGSVETVSIVAVLVMSMPAPMQLSTWTTRVYVVTAPGAIDMPMQSIGMSAGIDTARRDAGQEVEAVGGQAGREATHRGDGGTGRDREPVVDREADERDVGIEIIVQVDFLRDVRSSCSSP